MMIKYLLIACIKFYRVFISPILPCACRFQPTCSDYMIDAIKIHGILYGLYLGIRRISSCHPFGKSGYDPVPSKKASAQR